MEPETVRCPETTEVTPTEVVQVSLNKNKQKVLLKSSTPFKKQNCYAIVKKSKIC